jgi:16S rRNA (adenine1518-N6/adenine1519-N6)-dimethyltransferase
LKAKKSYGQHFLVNENLAKNIADTAIELSDKYPVLEIGPGKGVLTKYFYEKKINFKSVEADMDMIEYLHSTYPGISINLIFKDILKLDLNEVFDEEFVLFGNFPYNISSQILFKMIEYKYKIPVLIGMFQREVAERIIASPGNKEYGILSVLVQAYYSGKIVFRVKPGSFSPPPKVDSAVIKLERKEKFELDCNETLFKTIVKSTFNKRRKMIRNTLKSLINDDEILKDDFFKKRPEQLSLDEFVELTNVIEGRLMRD